MAETLLKEYGESVESFTLIPSSGGVFEVEVDGAMLFSKKDTGRHTSPEEVLKLLASRST